MTPETLQKANQLTKEIADRKKVLENLQRAKNVKLRFEIGNDYYSLDLNEELTKWTLQREINYRKAYIHRLEEQLKSL